MLNLTQVPAPRVPLVDERTGLVSTEWFRFFNGLYAIVGENQNTIQPANGGTGLSATPTKGQLLIGNDVGYTLNTLTPGAGIGVTNGAGSITLANTGVLSWSAGITGLTPATAAIGNVTLSGLLNVASGGTGQSSYTDGQLLIGNTTGNTLGRCWHRHHQWFIGHHDSPDQRHDQKLRCVPRHCYPDCRCGHCHCHHAQRYGLVGRRGYWVAHIAHRHHQHGHLQPAVQPSASQHLCAD
jgi:hypothetical protein